LWILSKFCNAQLLPWTRIQFQKLRATSLTKKFPAPSFQLSESPVIFSIPADDQTNPHRYFCLIIFPFFQYFLYKNIQTSQVNPL